MFCYAFRPKSLYLSKIYILKNKQADINQSA